MLVDRGIIKPLPLEQVRDDDVVLFYRDLEKLKEDAIAEEGYIPKIYKIQIIEEIN